jgi:hypothetical protein
MSASTLNVVMMVGVLGVAGALLPQPVKRLMMHAMMMK